MGTFYVGIFDSDWWLLRITSLALGIYYTVDNREMAQIPLYLERESGKEATHNGNKVRLFN